MADLWREFWILSWASLQRNSAGIGIVLSVVGFGITWWQLIRTRRAAAAAQAASRAAYDAVGRADTIADIAMAQAGYHELQLALRGGRHEAAAIRCQALRETLARVRKRTGFEADARQIRFQKMVTELRRLQDAMERTLAQPDTAVSFSAPAANKRLADAAAELGSWIEEMRYSTGGTI